MVNAEGEPVYVMRFEPAGASLLQGDHIMSHPMPFVPTLMLRLQSVSLCPSLSQMLLSHSAFRSLCCLAAGGETC